MLTVENLATLSARFSVEQHEFLNKNTYIREAAIATRIEEVDPGWMFEIVNITRRDQQIAVHARMTINGVTRENTGMAMIEMNKDKTREANEAEKSATTDAFKRCARMFAVGRYLLELPKWVCDEVTLRNFFEGKQPTQRSQQGGQNQRQQSGGQPPRQQQSNGQPSGKPAASNSASPWWTKTEEVDRFFQAVGMMPSAAAKFVGQEMEVYQHDQQGLIDAVRAKRGESASTDIPFPAT